MSKWVSKVHPHPDLFPEPHTHWFWVFLQLSPAGACGNRYHILRKHKFHSSSAPFPYTPSHTCLRVATTHTNVQARNVRANSHQTCFFFFQIKFTYKKCSDLKCSVWWTLTAIYPCVVTSKIRCRTFLSFEKVPSGLLVANCPHPTHLHALRGFQHDPLVLSVFGFHINGII